MDAVEDLKQIIKKLEAARDDLLLLALNEQNPFLGLDQVYLNMEQALAKLRRIIIT